jgi:hypothetical protein
LLADKLLDDLLLLERPPGEGRRASSTTGDTGLFELACLLEVPLSRALMPEKRLDIAMYVLGRYERGVGAKARDFEERGAFRALRSGLFHRRSVCRSDVEQIRPKEQARFWMWDKTDYVGSVLTH